MQSQYPLFFFFFFFFFFVFFFFFFFCFQTDCNSFECCRWSSGNATNQMFNLIVRNTGNSIAANTRIPCFILCFSLLFSSFLLFPFSSSILSFVFVFCFFHLIDKEIQLTFNHGSYFTQLWNLELRVPPSLLPPLPRPKSCPLAAVEDEKLAAQEGMP